MEFLPLCFRLHDQSCLIVGGGEVAYRKALLLHKAHASITIVAPEVGDSIKSWFKDEPSISSKITLHQRPFQTSDLIHKKIVVAATK